MNTQFKKGVLEICILKLISDKDMYGFEVINELSNLLTVNENTIYPVLRRLTKQGLFETYEVKNALGANRKYYRVTAKGLKKLKIYLKEWRCFTQNVDKILGGQFDE